MIHRIVLCACLLISSFISLETMAGKRSSNKYVQEQEMLARYKINDDKNNTQNIQPS